MNFRLAVERLSAILDHYDTGPPDSHGHSFGNLHFKHYTGVGGDNLARYITVWFADEQRVAVNGRSMRIPVLVVIHHPRSRIVHVKRFNGHRWVPERTHMSHQWLAARELRRFRL